MFESSRPSLLLDYLGVPHEVAERERPLAGTCTRVRLRGDDPDPPAVYWPEPGEDVPPRAEHRWGSVPLFTSVVPDPVTAGWRTALGGWWRPAGAVHDDEGRAVASIWRDERGNAFLPFDPDDVMRTLWSEGYRDVGGVSAAARAKRVAMRGYYRLRPALPRVAQIAMRRLFSRVQAKTRYPRWPVEAGLHDLYDLLLDLLASVAGRPVPTIAPWPAGKTWALVLTHDVETSFGYERIPLVRDAELAAGCRSSWNLVPRRYEVDDGVVADLKAQGFEVGVHGLYHDGRDLESRAVLEERLPEIRAWAERWGATGFRSPATHRNWEWMPLLGFDYDSSYPDTDPFEPQGGGCCTWLPFMNDGLVELPITLPQDHTIFVILRQPDESLWLEKAEFLRSRGGMALIDTHPDYLVEGNRLELYSRFLAQVATAPDVWRALPAEVSAWWRRRAASRLVREGEGWRVVGPAAGEAAVTLVPAPEREVDAVPLGS